MRTLQIATALLLVTLAGCGGDSNDAGTASAQPSRTSATTSVSPGPSAFMADINAAGFGNKDTTDPAFLDFANQQVCAGGFGGGFTYGQVMQVLLETDAKPTEHQADVLVRSAVRNLCPEYAGKLP